jgi:hypothetical protein
MTSQECAEVLALIRAAILDERERTAKAAGMAADLTRESPYENDSSAMVMAEFGRRLREKA